MVSEEEVKKRYRSYFESDKRDKKRYMIMGMVAIVVIALILFMPIQVKPGAVCGNGIEEEGENCFDCPKDVPCEGLCDPVTKECKIAVCGNGECESGENFDNCCDDCGCATGVEICDEETHQCYVPEASITDERAIELINEYYSEQGKTVEWVEIKGSTFINNKPAKSASVNLTGEEFTLFVAVTVDGEVIEYPTF